MTEVEPDGSDLLAALSGGRGGGALRLVLRHHNDSPPPSPIHRRRVTVRCAGLARALPQAMATALSSPRPTALEVVVHSGGDWVLDGALFAGDGWRRLWTNGCIAPHSDSPLAAEAEEAIAYAWLGAEVRRFPRARRVGVLPVAWLAVDDDNLCPQATHLAVAVDDDAALLPPAALLERLQQLTVRWAADDGAARRWFGHVCRHLPLDACLWVQVPPDAAAAAARTLRPVLRAASGGRVRWSLMATAITMEPLFEP